MRNCRAGLLVVLAWLALGTACGTLFADTGNDEPTGPSDGEPAQPSDAAVELLGSEFFDADGRKHDESVLDADVIGIYFTASWCPPCTTFTPVLVDAYTDIRDPGGSFEVIMVPWDQTEDAVFDYMGEYEMPWYTLDLRSPKVDSLEDRYSVTGVPTLIVVDRGAAPISTDGRDDVTTHGSEAYEQWTEPHGG